MLFAGARLHTARVGCAVSVAVLSQHAARVESRRVCVFFVVWCLVYQYTIYAYGVYVCMCVSGAAHSASAPKTRNGQNQRATGKKPERAQHAHRAPTLGGVTGPSDRRGGVSRVGSLITGSGAEPQKKILPL